MRSVCSRLNADGSLYYIEAKRENVTFHSLTRRTSHWSSSNVDETIFPSQIVNVEVQEVCAANLAPPDIEVEALWRRGRDGW